MEGIWLVPGNLGEICRYTTLPGLNGAKTLLRHVDDVDVTMVVFGNLVRTVDVIGFDDVGIDVTGNIEDAVVTLHVPVDDVELAVDTVTSFFVAWTICTKRKRHCLDIYLLILLLIQKW